MNAALTHRPRAFAANARIGVRLLVVAGMVAIGVGATWLISLPPYYRADVRIALEQPELDRDPLARLPPEEQIEWDPTVFPRAMEKFSSEPVLKAALERCGYGKSLDVAAGELRRRYQVKPTRGTALVALRLFGLDPQEDERILNAIALESMDPKLWARDAAHPRYPRFKPELVEKPESEQIIHPQRAWAIGLATLGLVLSVFGGLVRIVARRGALTPPHTAEAQPTR